MVFASPILPKPQGVQVMRKKNGTGRTPRWQTVTCSSILTTVRPSDISGFQGSETAAALDVIRDYVAGVACH
ncbi:MAG: hypothetical protein KatS3mg032_1960 [Cyclobacteriaceae bacterium]|nr:MAG: hypothetical protein KatS3mg032_1960 [Cyclobacteriaceae bacterium]